LLDQVMARLRAEYVKARKETIFDRLKGSLFGADAESSLAETAAELGAGR